jgi:hypothetical protein
MVQALSIRTKLIMAILALVASIALMGATADDAHAGVTELRTVYNYTGKTVYVWNHESGSIKLINPSGNVFFNQWVPWSAGSTDFYRGKYIEVGYIQNGVKVHKYSIWQQNRNSQDRIRYTQLRGYDANAQPMPGVSTVNGRRDLVLWNLDAAATSTSTGVRLYNGQ